MAQENKLKYRPFLFSPCTASRTSVTFNSNQHLVISQQLYHLAILFGFELLFSWPTIISLLILVSTDKRVQTCTTNI